MKTIVISDLHLGVDDKIAENVKNRPLLISFLNKIIDEKLADEIVIAGDFLDQWFYPGNYELEGDSQKLYMQIAKNNQSVMDAFQKVIDSGIKLVYVPGNHDMTLKKETLDKILPGIEQARDVEGLGKYITGERKEIAIEHSHRYESFCAPDTITNKSIMQFGDPMLPPGYFYARIGVTSLLEHFPKVTKDIADIPMPSGSEQEMAAWMYYKIWVKLINQQFTVNEDIDDKFIKVNVDGLVGNYSIRQLVPTFDGKEINAELYKDFEKHWAQVQKNNKVAAPTTSLRDLETAMDIQSKIDNSKLQYFDLDDSIDVVVFGHSHIPAYKNYKDDFNGKDKIFVNCGTWVDNNFDDKNTAVFTIIDSTKNGNDVQLLKCIGTDKVENFEKVFNEHTEY